MLCLPFSHMIDIKGLLLFETLFHLILVSSVVFQRKYKETSWNVIIFPNNNRDFDLLCLPLLIVLNLSILSLFFHIVLLRNIHIFRAT